MLRSRAQVRTSARRSFTCRPTGFLDPPAPRARAVDRRVAAVVLETKASKRSASHFGRNPLLPKAKEEGLGQARGGQVPRSARQAPGLLGMLGCKPSHVSLAASAASASVIPISGYFGMIKRIIEALGLDDGFHQSPSHWSKTSMEIKQVELLATAA